jgi:hypothetical protein
MGRLIDLPVTFSKIYFESKLKSVYTGSDNLLLAKPANHSHPHQRFVYFTHHPPPDP